MAKSFEKKKTTTIEVFCKDTRKGVSLSIYCFCTSQLAISVCKYINISKYIFTSTSIYIYIYISLQLCILWLVYPFYFRANTNFFIRTKKKTKKNVYYDNKKWTKGILVLNLLVATIKSTSVCMYILLLMYLLFRFMQWSGIVVVYLWF